ncbi:MAG: DUF4494 domain-containing protein [Paludibacteraceae bacterium]|nr:DUF4494 domain-containing protein [Paludibacteraceae bacterium]MBQ9296726.1 DUF4494 domain-containing protein [Paludibacteraceae bacterium]
MLFYEIKVNYQRQTGEDNPGNVKETYLVEGLNCSDVENRLMEEIKPFIFGDCEVPSCKKAQFFDIFPNEGSEYWYKGRVEMITIDGEKETRKAVSVLVQANTLDDAVHALKQYLGTYDCEIISVAKSPIMDVIRAVN